VAFLLRTVSTSAEGREIVRTARVEGDRLTIGRGPESDVRLTDLAVGLLHASVEKLGSRLEVFAEEGVTVHLNGRKTARGAVALATPGRTRYGSTSNE
jgi:hypothetical protein